MTYIKINKSSLDYHQYSDFHLFTMNNFVRNVMKNGKYKKAIKLVRLGLFAALKELRYKLKLNDERVARPYRTLPKTFLTEDTKKNIKTVFNNKNKRYKIDSKSLIGKYIIKKSQLDIIEDDRLNYYNNLANLLNSKKSNFSFFQYFNSIVLQENIDAYPGNFKELKYPLNPINSEKAPIDKYNYQYNKFEQIKFKKIYTKKPRIHYYGIRNLTAFDMVIQVYTMLTGVWYMRKAKVSGRTILIPSPLRPYRRITTVTKMLMKGIRKRRREERFRKKAMIGAIGTEFYWLLLYNGVQYGRAQCIDNSFVWNAKMDSHKELVYNLKNIKHLKYF